MEDLSTKEYIHERGKGLTISSIRPAWLFLCCNTERESSMGDYGEEADHLRDLCTKKGNDSLGAGEFLIIQKKRREKEPSRAWRRKPFLRCVSAMK